MKTLNLTYVGTDKGQRILRAEFNSPIDFPLLGIVADDSISFIVGEDYVDCHLCDMASIDDFLVNDRLVDGNGKRGDIRRKFLAEFNDYVILPYDYSFQYGE